MSKIYFLSIFTVLVLNNLNAAVIKQNHVKSDLESTINYLQTTISYSHSPNDEIEKFIDAKSMLFSKFDMTKPSGVFKLDCKQTNDLCSKYQVYSALCENKNYGSKPEASWVCDFDNVDHRVLIKSYIVECQNSSDDKNSFIKDTCYLRYDLNLNPIYKEPIKAEEPKSSKPDDNSSADIVLIVVVCIVVFFVLLIITLVAISYGGCSCNGDCDERDCERFCLCCCLILRCLCMCLVIFGNSDSNNGGCSGDCGTGNSSSAQGGTSFR